MSRRKYYAVTAIALTAIGFYVAIQFGNDPAVGTVKTVEPPQANVVKPVVKFTQVTGTTIAFGYPDNFTISELPTPLPPVIENYRYIYKNVRTSQLAVTVVRLDAAGADSSLQLRRQDPAHYSETNISSAGNDFIIMTDTRDSFNKVAYTTHGGLAGEIAVSGNTGQGTNTLSDSFVQILNSWQWR